MNKNYYEILEVDKKASSEIIKKAYNTLAKKYHPDLQPEDKKQEAEKNLKLINEAYETLSNRKNRLQYDRTLIDSTISREDFDAICEENEQLKYIIHEMQNRTIIPNRSDTNINNNEPRYNHNNQSTYQNNSANDNNMNSSYKDYENNLKRAYQQAYHDAYIQNLRNQGYKIKYKKTYKDYIKNLFALLLTILILYILWQIPFIQNTIKSNILFNLLP